MSPLLNAVRPLYPSGEAASTRDMTDGAPRDASKMGSNSRTALYAALVIGVAIVIALAVYSSGFTSPEATTAPVPPATTTQ